MMITATILATGLDGFEDFCSGSSTASTTGHGRAPPSINVIAASASRLGRSEWWRTRDKGNRIIRVSICGLGVGISALRRR